MFTAPNVYKVDIADKILHESSPKHSFGHKVDLEKPLETPGGFCNTINCNFPNLFCFCLKF